MSASKSITVNGQEFFTDDVDADYDYIVTLAFMGKGHKDGRYTITYSHPAGLPIAQGTLGYGESVPIFPGGMIFDVCHT